MKPHRFCSLQPHTEQKTARLASKSFFRKIPRGELVEHILVSTSQNLWVPCQLTKCGSRMQRTIFPLQKTNDLNLECNKLWLNFSWTTPNTLSIHYMKCLASESIRNPFFNLDLLRCSSCLAWLRISTLEHFWDGFDSDTELFMFQT